MEESETTSSPVFHIVTILITVLSFILSSVLFMTKFAIWQAFAIALGCYFVTFCIFFMLSRHPSSMGVPIETSYNAPVQWRLLLIVTGVFTVFFSGIVYSMI